MIRLSRATKEDEMTSFILTEIALDLLGNKFYTVDGEHVRDLHSLYKLNHTEPKTGEPSLQQLMCVSDTSLNAADNNEDIVISLDNDDSESNDSADGSSSQQSHDVLESQTIDLESGNTEDECEVLFQTTTANIQDKKSPTPTCDVEGSASTSTSQNKPEYPLRYIPIANRKMLFSSDINDRLSYILQEAGNEYNRMKVKSKEMKTKFLEMNKKVIDFKELRGEDCLSQFQCQEHHSLVEESNALIQFLKLVDHEDKYPKELCDRIAGDILKAKNLIT